MHVSVSLVLDPVFGDRVAALAQQMPVWVVSSPVNDQAVRLARSNLGEGRITSLHRRPGEASCNLLARAVYAIDEHHGEVSQVVGYDTLWVYGTAEKLPQKIATELGFKSITAIEDGFKAEKWAEEITK
ncbi:MAG: hypothetical protein H6R18_2010 [Proteobacteria bacterium]|nr:hypothetical protein [Pseudomonadota bacterium]